MTGTDGYVYIDDLPNWNQAKAEEAYIPPFGLHAVDKMILKSN